MDAAGKIVAGFAIAHSADGIAVLCAGWPATVIPATCRSPSSARTAGWWTCCWRPGTRWCRSSRTRIKAWRDGEVLSGARSDAGDAAVIAEYLRLRAHKLTVAVPCPDETRALR